MKASLILAQCAGIASAALVATAEPQQSKSSPGQVTATPTLHGAAKRWVPDPTECETENLTPYFNPPTPTGELKTALNDYLISQGASHCSKSIATFCEELNGSAWCQFTSVAPTSLLEAYTTHASKLSVWSSKLSSGLAALPTKCPLSWDNWRFELQEGKGAAYQAEGIALANCYAKSKEESSKDGGDGKDKGDAGDDKTGGDGASDKGGKDGKDNKDDKENSASGESRKFMALIAWLVSCGVLQCYL